VATPFDFILDNHFRALTDREEAVRLFQHSVKMVEIEVFSYCNRRCWFCPNSFIDRLSTTEYMPEPLYLGLLEQLAAVGYRRTISYSRYNEPLADRIILRRLEQARQHLPYAALHTNTNGDYLTREYLDELAAAGLGSLSIQIYLGNRDRYDHERMRERLERQIEKLALNATITIDEPGRWLEATAERPGMRLRLYARNFDTTGCSRGDSVPIQIAAPRTSPCLSPFQYLYVDYNGSMMPCCNLRSDVPAHAGAVIANLHETPDIVRVYAGATLAEWRKSLVGFEPKRGVCAGCSFMTYEETPEHRAVQDRLRASAAQERRCA
jgi:MoaA/NifB/PqqE/SkfB family radical SAM enzyme